MKSGNDESNVPSENETSVPAEETNETPSVERPLETDSRDLPTNEEGVDRGSSTSTPVGSESAKP